MDNVIILAGGQGKRMKAEIPKPMFEVLEVPMLEWVIKACEKSELSNICVVKGYMADVIDTYLNGRYETVLQEERLGTGHAVMQAISFMEKNIDGNTLVLCGDAPFIDSETIIKSREMHVSENNSVTVITAELDEPKGYGRIVRNENGIECIVEEKDATCEQKKIKEINSGTYWFKTADLIESLNSITRNNSQGEYYLTDTVFIALEKGYRANAYISQNANVVKGANDRKGLLELNTIARMNVIENHMENGVEFTCLDGIEIGTDVIIGNGTKILSGTKIKGKTKIGSNCVIGPNCLIVDSEIDNSVNLNYVQVYQSKIEDEVKIGPFVHIRPNIYIKKGAKIGDFVEIKNSTIGEKTAVAHLTYIGDSDVGSGVNFGCGVVTVNYDGAKKNRCIIKNGAFIGCNTNLIAPVTIGEKAYTAAGSTVNKDVADYALAIERNSLVIKENFAKRKLGLSEK